MEPSACVRLICQWTCGQEAGFCVCRDRTKDRPAVRLWRACLDPGMFDKGLDSRPQLPVKTLQRWIYGAGGGGGGRPKMLAMSSSKAVLSPNGRLKCTVGAGYPPRATSLIIDASDHSNLSSRNSRLCRSVKVKCRSDERRGSSEITTSIRSWGR